MGRLAHLIEKFAGKLEEPVALRVFDYEFPSGDRVEVKASVWRPFQIPIDEDNPDGTWACFWQVTGTAHDNIKATYGADSYQALEHALFITDVEIDLVAGRGSGRLLQFGEPYVKMKPGDSTKKV